jgi:hypothetical protein
MRRGTQHTHLKKSISSRTASYYQGMISSVIRHSPTNNTDMKPLPSSPVTFTVFSQETMPPPLSRGATSKPSKVMPGHGAFELHASSTTIRKYKAKIHITILKKRTKKRDERTRVSCRHSREIDKVKVCKLEQGWRVISG